MEYFSRNTSYFSCLNEHQGKIVAEFEAFFLKRSELCRFFFIENPSNLKIAGVWNQERVFFAINIKACAAWHLNKSLPKAVINVSSLVFLVQYK